MRPHLWLVPALLALSGCDIAPSDPGYGYAPVGYPPGGYPGYSYGNGAPTYFGGGAAVPLVLMGGEWGFYDHDRHWHRAPDRVSHDLDAHRAGRGPVHSDAAGRPERYVQPGSGQPGSGQPGSGQPGSGQPWSGEHGGHVVHRPAEPVRPPAAPVAAAPQRHEEHDRRRDCPAGQRC